ncbi:MAG TPA: hypothetical protein VHV83_06850 [Armatimonadota bacterium]|nr:hypothetical protein [Armatimonadota bacterium]
MCRLLRKLPCIQQALGQGTEIALTYIDDVVAGFLAEVDAPRRSGFRFAASLAARALADAARRLYHAAPPSAKPWDIMAIVVPAQRITAVKSFDG